MRREGRQVVFFPPDFEGILGGAALRHALGTADRRIYGTATEPNPRQLHVIDVAPTDSVESLLLPALRQLDEAQVRVRWYYGRDEPASHLGDLAEVVELVYEVGARGWRLASKDAASFAERAAVIDERGAAQDAWTPVLRALSTSWDWARIYGAVDALARLEMPGDDDARWAEAQLALVGRAAQTIAGAPVRTGTAALVATVTDPALAASVRVEGLAGVRDDVDAVAFVAGPRRLKLIATSPAGLSFLDEVEGLQADFEQHVVVGSVTPGYAELTWTPGSVPASVAVLVGEEAVDRAQAVDVGAVARIERPPEGRMGKGLHPARLAPEDLATLREALATEPGTDEDAFDDPGADPSPAPTLQDAVLRNPLELLPETQQPNP